MEIIVCTNNHIITMTASVMPGVHSLISRSDIYVLTLCHYVMISRYQDIKDPAENVPARCLETGVLGVSITVGVKSTVM